MGIRIRCQPRLVPEPGELPPYEIERINGELVALIYNRLPLRYYGGEPWWSVSAAALVLRMAGTLESITSLLRSPHSHDRTVLLRALWEHVVVFSWISADPEARFFIWIDHASFRMLQAHRDAVGLGLEPLLTEHEIKNTPARKLPELKVMARDADEHWGPRLTGWRIFDPKSPSVLTLRGLYTYFYRVASRTAHAEPETVEPYIDADSAPIAVRLPIEGNFLHAQLAGPMFALALLVAADRYKWISPEAVLQIVDTA
jgi:hypothetical protein